MSREFFKVLTIFGNLGIKWLASPGQWSSRPPFLSAVLILQNISPFVATLYIENMGYLGALPVHEKNLISASLCKKTDLAFSLKLAIGEYHCSPMLPIWVGKLPSIASAGHFFFQFYSGPNYVAPGTSAMFTL